MGRRRWRWEPTAAPLLSLDRPLERAPEEILKDRIVPCVVAVADGRAEDARAAVVADPREGYPSGPPG